MNAAYVHLLLNHVPVLGVVFGLALLGWAVSRRDDRMLRAGWATLVVVALIALPVYFTGEGAEEVVEDEPGVVHQTIKDHEEMALFAIIGMEALGLLALWGLVRSRRTAPPPWLGKASLAAALVVAVLMGMTAERGGRVRHPEAHGGTLDADGEGRGKSDDRGHRGPH